MITLPRITSGYASIAAINNALEQMEKAINDTLSRVEATGNQMDEALDMNSNRLLNLPSAATDHEPVTLGQLRSMSTVVLYEPNPHTHVWDDITDKPAQYPPSTHTHTINQVTGLSAMLAQHDNVLMELVNRPRVYVQAAEPIPARVNDVWIY